MKRIVSFIMAVGCCFGAVFFSSCNKNGGTDTHQHKYVNEWSFDDTAHWKICEVEGCNSKTSYSAHTYKENNSDPTLPKNICTACGYVERVTEHTHTYDKKYISNGSEHWYRCTKIGCDAVTERESHAYGNPEIIQEPNRIIKTLLCVDCKYKTVDVYDISSVIKDADAWNAAFRELEFSNYSAKVVKETPDKSEYNANYVAMAENGAYYCDNNGDLEYYTLKTEDGFATYERMSQASGSNETFIKRSSNGDSYYKGAKNATFMHVSFENNFELFTYDIEKGQYVCKDDISAFIYNFDGSINERSIFCNNITIKMTDGKITYMSMNYYFGDEGKELYNRTLVYYNIGMTKVTVAKSIIENATVEQ